MIGVDIQLDILVVHSKQRGEYLYGYIIGSNRRFVIEVLKEVHLIKILTIFVA